MPEFNFGAMENAGCVVFRDEYLFRSRVTAREIQARDNTILHELAHMWFGDLVTMRWWDDLWLNESFAEWASHFAAEEIANRYGTGENPWASFCNERKSWAYRQDQLSTTHPIAADMSDLERVEQNFDGITYAKGASVLKLLVSFVGKDKFLAGVGSYFTKHAYANTSLNDLLVELEAASGKDLSWFSQQWLETAGVNTLRADFDLDEHGNFTRFVIQQSAAEHLPTLRHHRLGIGLYHLGDDGLVRQHYTELDIEGETTEVPDLVGVNRGDLILLNDGDLTYAKIRLDEKSIETLVAHIHQLTDPLARAVVWSAFWDMARDAEIAPQQFVALAMQGVTTETDMTAATVALRQAETCSLPFVAPELREARNRKLVAGLAGLLKEAQAGSDLQRIIAKTLVRSARSEAALDLVRGWLDGEETPVGLSVDNELRWDIITTLARSGSADEALIEHELMNDRTSAGAERTAEAMTALPTTEHKAEAWRLATEDPSVPNETHRRICSSFMLYGQEELLVDYVDRYFECCEQISARQGGWESRGYAAIDAVTRGLFPAPLADEALIQRFEDWLASAEPSQQVQRVIREQLDEARRCLALQQRSTMAE
ncbi:MAG: aminopeptidase N [Arachnia propionica]|nr:MAG: aminopeptidase N [Arachnia propionica]